jgi:hypothetical protein
MIDGSSVSMPDTPELQASFPQVSNQAPGCGFPTARLEAIFCWGTGALIDWRMGSLSVSEAAMYRDMIDVFEPGDIALADRYYCAYTDIARLLGRGCDVVFRMHASRPADFRKGSRLGPDDRLVEWTRPAWSPTSGLSREQHQALPRHLILRMIRTRRIAPGFRTEKITIITSILDLDEATSDELLALYQDRWMVEVDLRALKTTFRMDVLRGKTVDIVRKEILMHLTLHNLLRILMCRAAATKGVPIRRTSFAGALDRLRAIGPRLFVGGRLTPGLAVAWEWLVACVAKDLVPNRPGRSEPRRKKRRPKGYDLLMKPRHEYRCEQNLCR